MEFIIYALLYIIPISLLALIFFLARKWEFAKDLIALSKNVARHGPIYGSEFYGTTRRKVYESDSEKIIDIDFNEISDDDKENTN
jgi:hypothetical protein